jgi:hypothetical protein
VLPSAAATVLTAPLTVRLAAASEEGFSSPASAAAASTVPLQVRKSLAENSSPIAAWM